MSYSSKIESTLPVSYVDQIMFYFHPGSLAGSAHNVAVWRQAKRPNRVECHRQQIPLMLTIKTDLLIIALKKHFYFMSFEFPIHIANDKVVYVDIRSPRANQARAMLKKKHFALHLPNRVETKMEEISISADPLGMEYS